MTDTHDLSEFDFDFPYDNYSGYTGGEEMPAKIQERIGVLSHQLSVREIADLYQVDCSTVKAVIYRYRQRHSQN